MIELMKIEKYIEAKSKLSFYKKLELKLRNEILESQFPSACEGTHNAEVDLFQIKGSFSNSMSIDKDALEDNEEFLSDEEKACIVYKPSISVTEYKKLRDNDKILIDDIIVIKPKQASLTITMLEEEE